MRTVIIGGGASGMMAAITAANGKDVVTVIEKNSRAGKKILATGNGKCNFSNASCQLSSYFCDDKDFVRQALLSFSQEEAVSFFNRIGIYPRIIEGRMYPYSEQAIAVADALLYEVKDCGVNLITDMKVIGVVRGQSEFYIHMTASSNKGEPRHDQIKTIEADKVIIATGGRAGEQYGCTGDGYKFAQDFGHTVIKPLPALVQLTSQDQYLKEMHGARTKGEVSLYVGRKKVMKQSGEVQFTKDGISGICVFDLSRLAARALDKNKNCELMVDLVPELDEKELEDLLSERVKNSPRKYSIDCLDGLVNRKMQQAVLRKAGIFKTRRYCSKLSIAEIEAVASTMKSMRFKITGTKGWQDAQTTSGGICIGEVNVENMESKTVKGLHFCGEILDVDGICGGFNLQWAWSSGYLAGCKR